MVDKIFDYFFGNKCSIIVGSKIFMNALLDNKITYGIIYMLFCSVYIIYTLDIKAGELPWLYLGNIFFIVMYLGPLFFILTNVYKNIFGYKEVYKENVILSRVVYQNRLFYYIIYYVIALLLILTYLYIPEKGIELFEEFQKFSTELFFMIISFTGILLFIIAILFGPFNLSKNHKGPSLKGYIVDEKLLQEFKEKSRLMIGCFLGIFGMTILLVKLSCGVSFCGGMLAGFFIPVALVSMIVHLLIGRKTLGMKSKDFMLEKLESISFAIFEISLGLGFIFSFM